VREKVEAIKKGYELTKRSEENKRQFFLKDKLKEALRNCCQKKVGKMLKFENLL